MDVDITCPRCHQLDGVQSVPAICADGVSTSYDTGTYTGVGIASTGLVPVVGTTTIERSHSTALARSLVREPIQKPTVGLALLAMALLLFTALMLVIALTTKMYPHPDDHSLSPIIAAILLVGAPAVPGLLILHAVYARGRRNSRIARGRPRAMAVWGAGWYCHRCYLAFWPYPPLPEIPARHGVTPDQFRWLVWKAGGYLNR
ncbi:hypothetical protein [Nocardia paucivorans]|uniref:hypothetical protein n=1 Tax=Nocardia paucivorans TaxID=114259 RepID=UPI000313187B|nr:hypothetical protein [Nocardia paucivorans]